MISNKVSSEALNYDLEIIICTHNRCRLLAKTLESIESSNFVENKTVSVLIIANSCTDDTHVFLDNYCVAKDANKQLYLRWLQEETPGKSYALNTALENSSSDLLAFVDDDHRVSENFIFEIFKATQDYPDIDIFCGKILPDWDGSEPPWVHDEGMYRIYPKPVPHFNLGDSPLLVNIAETIPGGGNIMIKKEMFKKVGSFSIDLGPTGHNLRGSEDIDWLRRAAKTGAQIQFVPEIIQYHFVDPKRLKLRYLCIKAFERSATSTESTNYQQTNKIPLYLYRKAFHYFFQVFISIRTNRRRFYLVRFFSALGEMKGLSKKGL